jgi:tetratricopeptide (TPR) repeat protein
MKQAFEVFGRTVGSAHVYAGIGHQVRGRIALGRGRYPDAASDLRRATEILGSTLGTTHTVYGSALGSLGDALTALGRRREGIAALERALELLTTRGNDRSSSALGETQFALARALWPGERQRALSLAKTAREVLKSHPYGRHVSVWLASASTEAAPRTADR